MKDAAKFTRDNPCTKVHIWNCFRKPTGYVSVPVVEAKRQIGDNAPKYMLKQGFAEATTYKSVDYYVLTRAGEQWLESGLRRHLVLHPEERSQVKVPPPGSTRRRTAVAVPVAPKPPVLRRRR